MDGMPDNPYMDDLPHLEEYSLKELLSLEKEVLGIYLSGHPLSEHQAVLNNYVNFTSVDFLSESDMSMQDGAYVCYGGLITSKSVKYTRNTSKAMAFISVEDMYGAVEVIVFSQLYEKFSSKLIEEQVVLIIGRASVREDENTKIVANEIHSFEELSGSPDQTLWLKACSDDLERVTEILSAHKGKNPVMVYDEPKKKRLRLKEDYWVNLNEPLMNELKECLGTDAVKVKLK
jgi:DNA polymerase-3 subunit alpha